MGGCAWTTSPTPQVRKDSPPACNASARISAPGSPTAASTRHSGRATSCCRWPTAVTSKSSEALDHPAVDQAPFGRAVRARTEAGGGWFAWIIRVDDISPVEARLGRSAAPGHRQRPDGFDLRWQQIGINDVESDPQLPFFIRWQSDDEHHPSRRAAPSRLSAIEIAGDEKVVDDYLGTSARQPLEGIVVSWRDDDDVGAGLVAAMFDTAHGSVRID